MEAVIITIDVPHISYALEHPLRYVRSLSNGDASPYDYLLS